MTDKRKPWEHPPTRTTRLTNPTTGQRYEVLDYRGSQHLPERPEILYCDYCCVETRELWFRKTRPFGVELFPGGYMVFDGGDWSACAGCHPLVSVRDLDGLARRVSRMDPRVAPFCRNLHAVVFACQEDRECHWSSGQKFPVPHVREDAR